jgi:AcrR family transcriptional regulator
MAQRGRPRSTTADQAILEAFRVELTDKGFADVRLEHVAARAGVGKATIYRRYSSKEALAEALLGKLAGAQISIFDRGDTRAELLAAVTQPMRAVTDSPFGPVIRALVSQIAIDAELRASFSRDVVAPRRADIAKVVQRGIERGDLDPTTNATIAIDLLLGPIYFRVMFGGELTPDFANSVVDTYVAAFGTGSAVVSGRGADSEATYPAM